MRAPPLVGRQHTKEREMMEGRNNVQMVMSPDEAMFIAWSARIASDYLDSQIHFWKSESDEDVDDLMRIMSARFTARKIRYEIGKMFVSESELLDEANNDFTTDEISKMMGMSDDE
jgi:hypothetical protein